MAEHTRILIIEDTDTDAELVECELRKGGIAFTSRRVETREAFKRELTDFAPDIVLSDYTLPQFNGLEALCLLQERELDTPFVLITGSMTEEVAVECMKQGISDYILKTSLKRLPSAVLNALEKVEAERMRERMIEALRESEERYRVFVRNSSEAIWRVEMEVPLPVSLPADEQAEHIYRFGYLAECNDAMAKMYGFDRAEEIVGFGLDQLLPRSNPENIESLRAFVRSGYRLLDAESIERDREGNQKYFLNNLVGIIKDGFVLRIWGTQRDITDRKRVEAERDAERQLLNALIEQLPAGVLFCDRQGRYTRSNRRVGEILGVESGSLIGMTSAESVALLRPTRPDGQPVAVAEVPSSVAHSTQRPTAPAEQLFTTPTGKRRVLVNAAPVVLHEGESSGSVIVFTDVTEQHATQEQLRQAQRMESIGLLAGGVAHDFNNLITVITGYSALLLKKLGPDSIARPYVEEIGQAGERAAGLTRQLLAFSRKQVLQPRVLDLNGMLPGVERMLRRLIGADIELHAVLEPGLGKIKADWGQIEQVIMNLVVNARDAMPTGGKLTIETANVFLAGSYAEQRVSVTPGDYVMIAVSDTGTGMDAETQSHIFEPFYTTKELGKGTGLGLSTVYGIVKQSGGHLWVYSEPGRGTTFKIYLPQVNEPADERHADAHRPETAGGTETVLVAEDEEAVRSFVCETLRMNGYRVLEASGGAEALSVCRNYQGEIHMLLTDVVMSQTGGRELAERACAERPGVKVLYMSGYTGETIAHHGVLGDGIAFLEKPFSPETLSHKVREVLDGARAGRGPGAKAWPRRAGESKEEEAA